MSGTQDTKLLLIAERLKTARLESLLTSVFNTLRDEQVSLFLNCEGYECASEEVSRIMDMLGEALEK